MVVVACSRQQFARRPQIETGCQREGGDGDHFYDDDRADVGRQGSLYERNEQQRD